MPSKKKLLPESVRAPRRLRPDRPISEKNYVTDALEQPAPAPTKLTKLKDARFVGAARQRFQLCLYQPTAKAAWRNGIASVKAFGLSDLLFIVDADTGIFLETVWDYRLQDGPLCYIDTKGAL